jgi:hypothetical protein
MTLVDELISVRAGILDAASEIPAEERATPFVGHWPIKDLLAHLAGWDYTNVEAAVDLRSGRLPAFYDDYDPGWASYNQELIETYGTEEWDELMSLLKESQAAFLDAIADLGEEEVAAARGPAWRGHDISLLSVLRAAVRDESEHLQQIRSFVASIGA